jgi:hypothetical protein
MWGGFGGDTKCDFPLFPQHAQDYRINFVNYGNADEFVYGTCARGDAGPSIVFRVPKEDFLSLDVSKYQYYKGGDGLLSGAWSGSINAAATVPSMCEGGIGATGGGIEFVPDFNGYLLACPYSAVEWAPYIWGPYTRIAYPLRVQTHLNYIPWFPSPLAHTYQKLSASPLTAKMTLLANRNTRGLLRNYPASDEYSPHWREMTLTANAAVPAPPQVSRDGSSTTHIGSGLDCFLDFQPHSPAEFTSGALPDRAPNGQCRAKTGPAYDEHGMYNFGLWTGLADPTICDPGCVKPQPYTVRTPYTKTNTAFTLALVFALPEFVSDQRRRMRAGQRRHLDLSEWQRGEFLDGEDGHDHDECICAAYGCAGGGNEVARAVSALGTAQRSM